MKKTLLVVAVMAAAGSVNAAEVYNNDGSTLEVNGRAFAVMQVEDNAKTDSGFYAGVGYALGSKTTVFVEYSQLDTEAKGDFESGATAGIVVNF